MKLRASFFNPTVLRKDLTRFAPAWVLYTVGLFMVLCVCFIDNTQYYMAQNLAGSLSFMAALNLGYGLLNGQLLFGDLFNARHCNALHAMHLRRECWFFTHITAGLLFALVPDLLMALVAILMLGSASQVALWWLLAAMLQYLFFFGLSAFSALCVGSRFAMVLVYGITNFFSLIVYWFYDSIYEPLLYGVKVDQEAFTRFCPVWTMIENDELLQIENVVSVTKDYDAVRCISLGNGWDYLAVCAVLGVVLAALALMFYRRRSLESAGDFIAVPFLSPVFLTLYTMSMAAFFQAFADLFGLSEYVFLGLGLAVGFFTCRMLLMRTTRVFQPKAFLQFAVLAVAFAASLALTTLDPLGITQRIPEADKIRKVCFSNTSNPESGLKPTLTDPADIDAIRQLHSEILGSGEQSDGINGYHTNLSIRYYLTNGTTVTRSYLVAIDSPAGELAESFFSRPEYVLGAEADYLLDNLDYVNFYSYIYEEYAVLEPGDPLTEGLLHALEADCLAGRLAQNWGYHQDEENIGFIDLQFVTPNGIHYCQYFDLYSGCTNTLAYLTEHIYPLLTAEGQSE